jgi:hypothetical protein
MLLQDISPQKVALLMVPEVLVIKGISELKEQKGSIGDNNRGFF